MSKKIRGFLIDTVKATARESTLDGSLAGYYKALHCSIIDIVNREIGDKR